MDFFAHQEEARRSTVRLIIWFALAIVGTIAVIYLALIGVYHSRFADSSVPFDWWHAEVFLAVLFGCLIVIASGSIFKSLSLSDGGPVVAMSLGGRPVNRNTTEPHQRILINIVDEMSLASGVPAPRVFLLENEDSINAFAAGLNIDNAVIGVTQGCIERLNREELQGVIAHEFSHILNGDMRLNIRLISLLHGILLIGLTGYWMMRSTRGRSSRNKNGGGIVLVGLILFVTGYVGFFFSKLIKASVSRQREFLADASAVQFTRNPYGIRNALSKIGGYSKSSRIQHRNAETVSHLFFGNALKPSFLQFTSDLFATHPPLDERIRRIDPSFKGGREHGQSADSPNEQSELVSRAAPVSSEQQSWASPLPFAAEDAMNRVGQLSGDDLRHAIQIENRLAGRVDEFIRDAYGACVAIYGLLLAPGDEVREQQWQHLAEQTGGSTLKELIGILPELDALDAQSRIALVELASPSLKLLSANQAEHFARTLDTLIDVDGEVRFFEFMLRRLVLNQLQLPKANVSAPKSEEELTDCIADLIAVVAFVGGPDREGAEQAYNRSMKQLLGSVGGQIPMLPQLPDMGRADLAIQRLHTLKITLRRKIIATCALCIEHDGRTTIEEVQLLRVIAESFECPIPPIAPNESESIQSGL